MLRTGISPELATAMCDWACTGSTRAPSGLGTCSQQGPLLACRGFSDISSPMLGRKTLSENLLQKKPKIPHSLHQLREENLHPIHREPVSPGRCPLETQSNRCDRSRRQARGSGPKGVCLPDIWPGAACSSPAGRRTRAGKSCKKARVAMTPHVLDKHVSDPALTRRARAGVNAASSSQRGRGTKGA